MRVPRWQQPQQILSVEQQGKGQVPGVTTCGTTVAPNFAAAVQSDRRFKPWSKSCSIDCAGG